MVLFLYMIYAVYSCIYSFVFDLQNSVFDGVPKAALSRSNYNALRNGPS